MLLPYTVDVPMERVPVANWLLLSATAVVSFAAWVAPRPAAPEVNPDDDFDTIVQRAEREAAEDRTPALALDPERFAAWQLFTYVLVHADVLHLAGNLIFLFVFGNAVNAKLGHVPFVLAYFLLGALAGGLQLLSGPRLPVVGASGAIMGIVGMFLVLFPRNEVSILYWFWYAGAGVFEMASAWLILSYMLWDLFGTVFLSHSGIAYACHVGGALGGAALASGLVLTGMVTSTRYEQNLFQVLGVQSAEGEDRPKAPGKKKRRAKAGTRSKGRVEHDPRGWG